MLLAAIAADPRTPARSLTALAADPGLVPQTALALLCNPQLPDDAVPTITKHLPLGWSEDIRHILTSPGTPAHVRARLVGHVPAVALIVPAVWDQAARYDDLTPAEIEAAHAAVPALAPASARALLANPATPAHLVDGAVDVLVRTPSAWQWLIRSAELTTYFVERGHDLARIAHENAPGAALLRAPGADLGRTWARMLTEDMTDASPWLYGSEATTWAGALAATTDPALAATGRDRFLNAVTWYPGPRETGQAAANGCALALAENHRLPFEVRMAGFDFLRHHGDHPLWDHYFEVLPDPWALELYRPGLEAADSRAGEPATVAAVAADVLANVRRTPGTVAELAERMRPEDVGLSDVAASFALHPSAPPDVRRRVLTAAGDAPWVAVAAAIDADPESGILDAPLPALAALKTAHYDLRYDRLVAAHAAQAVRTLPADVLVLDAARVEALTALAPGSTGSARDLLRSIG